MSILKRFTHTEVVKITGLTNTQITHLTEKKTITPYKETTGRGHRRKYSYKNLIEFLVCRELKRYRIPERVMPEFLNDADVLTDDEIVLKKGRVIIFVDLIALKQEAERGSHEQD